MRTMPPTIYTQKPWLETYTEIIDVRSPSEFTEDHIPGAINLPVLNDAERAEVGTMYKQCPFTARKVGAALVAKNISQHLTTHFAAEEKNYKPLVYCWRGGQRSGSMALVLGQIGWRVTILEGGYKTYRTYVRDQLEYLPAQFNYQILCGLTGSGKTYILRQMQEHGTQVLDLESLANHRGSLLGEEWQGNSSAQPSQKYFETLLLQQLQHFDINQPVWLESESNKIGQVHLPQLLWQKMKLANCIEIQLPMAERVQFLLQEYPHLVTYPDILKAKLEKLKFRCGKHKLNLWNQLIDCENWDIFVEDILQSHYDPTYSQSKQQNFASPEQVISISDLSNSSIQNLLARLSPMAIANYL